MSFSERYRGSLLTLHRPPAEFFDLRRHHLSLPKKTKAIRRTLRFVKNALDRSSHLTLGGQWKPLLGRLDQGTLPLPIRLLAPSSAQQTRASTMRIPREAWILVCDGRKALLLLNHGDAELPDLRIEEAVDNGPNLKTSEQGSDRPGRLADASGGSHRSAVEQTDWHHRQETAFAARLAEMLEVRHSEKQTSAIILVAPPRMLGDLRKVLSPRIRAATVNEVDKDLVNLPTDELERALTGA